MIVFELFTPFNIFLLQYYKKYQKNIFKTLHKLEKKT